MHRNQFGLSEIPSSDRDSARPSQIADRRKSQGLSQTFLRSVKAKISLVTRRGCRAEKIFVGMGPFSPQENEKIKKEVLGWMRETTLTGEVAPQGPRGRGIPQGCGHFVNSPHSALFPRLLCVERMRVDMTMYDERQAVRVATPSRSSTTSWASSSDKHAILKLLVNTNATTASSDSVRTFRLLRNSCFA